MKLTKMQIELVDCIVQWHREGHPARIEGGRGGLYSRFTTQTIKSLLKRGVIRYANPEWPQRGWTHPADGRFWYNTFEVEITPKGWDHIYKFQSTTDEA